jgi:hypothetical protein
VGRRARIPTAIATASAFALALAASACGHQGSTRTTSTFPTSQQALEALLTSATASTQAAKSARETVSGTLTLVQGGEEQRLSITGAGETSFTRPTTADLTTKYSLPETTDGFTIRAIATGGTIYERLSLLPTRWIEFKGLASLQAAGVASPLTLGGGSTSPVEVRQLAADGAVLSTAPSVTVGGVGYRVVRFEISHRALTRLVESAGLGRTVTRRALASIVGALGGDVYIGGNGLVWRTTADASESSGGIQLSLELSTTYSDYGAAVTVSPPPAGDVKVLPFGTDPLTIISPSGTTSAS